MAIEGFINAVVLSTCTVHLHIVGAYYPGHLFLYCFHATQRVRTATIRPAMAIPAYAPSDNPPPLELDGLLVGLAVDDDVVKTVVIDGVVVADTAASGLPH
jgi:hypothetical protein